MQEMFCFQCQQTAHNTGCDGKAGVCGKKADTANYQDEVIGALIGLAQAVQAGTATGEGRAPPPEQALLLMEGLFTTITNVNFNNETILQIKNDIEKEKAAVSTTHFADYDMAELWRAGEDVRSLKSLILFGLKGMAAYAYHARALGKTDPAVNRYFYEALAALGEEKSPDDLLKLVLKTGEVNLACMALLDAANTEAYGDPVPVTVPLTIEKGPFIVVSGHDLHDLKLLLEQTEGKGINIYTHSEMLPAHGYPELKKYPHLKGNFGTGWQNQQTEFHNIPAPILFTTNCLMPVRQSYCDRVFTTSVVSYPEIPHIGADKDFTPVIEKALECGGYPDDHPMTGMNGGHTVTTGFARNAVLAHAGEIVQLVKSGKIRHVFLIGGCDGAAPSRSYYTDFARMTPADTLILTLAWTLSGIVGKDYLNIGGYVGSVVADNATIAILLPALFFLVAIGLAFATGTSWGTFGILIPIVLAIVSNDTHLMIMTVAAVLAGSVGGDHVSPISDTTILASAGAQCHHIDHVSTQIPYVLVVAVSCVAGYLVDGITGNGILGDLTGLVCMLLIMGFFLKFKSTKNAD